MEWKEGKRDGQGKEIINASENTGLANREMGILGLWEPLSRSSWVPQTSLKHIFMPAIFTMRYSLSKFATNKFNLNKSFISKITINTGLPHPTMSSAFSLLSWQWSCLANIWENSRHTTDKVFFCWCATQSYNCSHYIIFWKKFSVNI